MVFPNNFRKLFRWLHTWIWLLKEFSKWKNHLGGILKMLKYELHFQRFWLGVFKKQNKTTTKKYKNYILKKKNKALLLILSISLGRIILIYPDELYTIFSFSLQKRIKYAYEMYSLNYILLLLLVCVYVLRKINLELSKYPEVSLWKQLWLDYLYNYTQKTSRTLQSLSSYNLER